MAQESNDKALKAELKKTQEIFKAILGCYHDALDGLITRTNDKSWQLPPVVAVDVAMQLTAVAFADNFNRLNPKPGDTQDIPGQEEEEFGEEEMEDGESELGD